VQPGTVAAARAPALPGDQWEALGPVSPDRRGTAVVARLAERGWGATAVPEELGVQSAGLFHLLVDALAAPRPPTGRQRDRVGRGAPDSLAGRVVTNLTGTAPTEAVVRAVDALLVHL